MGTNMPETGEPDCIRRLDKFSGKSRQNLIVANDYFYYFENYAEICNNKKNIFNVRTTVSASKVRILYQVNE